MGAGRARLDRDEDISRETDASRDDDDANARVRRRVWWITPRWMMC